MRLIQKSSNNLVVVASPGEDVGVGDYLLVDDPGYGRGLVAQVFDETYLEYPGMIEDLVREELVQSVSNTGNHDPLSISTISETIRDMRILKCKARGSLEAGHFTDDVAWLPSRVRSRVRKLKLSQLYSALGRKGGIPLSLGEANGDEYSVDLEDFDGRLTVITGRKESGKSHLAKLLGARLAAAGARVLIFDLNNEYSGLARSKDGGASPIAPLIHRLIPGTGLRFTLQYLGLGAVLSIMEHALDTPPITLRDFARLWETLEAQGGVSVRKIAELLQNYRLNEHVKEALQSRFHSFIASGLLTDREEECFRFEEALLGRSGGLFIIPLAKLNKLSRRIAVEAILGKVIELLARREIPPIFVFAEEVHLYLRETYWEDLVTRMRHYGVFPTFITNQPDAISPTVYRQADNIFLFNLTNERDLDNLGKALGVDEESLKAVARTLSPGSCLALAKSSKNLPVIVKVSPLDVEAEGETRKFREWLNSKGLKVQNA